MTRNLPVKQNGRPGSFVLIWRFYRSLCGRFGVRVIYATCIEVVVVVVAIA
jgi:hypothetical protein